MKEYTVRNFYIRGVLSAGGQIAAHIRLAHTEASAKLSVPTRVAAGEKRVVSINGNRAIIRGNGQFDGTIVALIWPDGFRCLTNDAHMLRDRTYRIVEVCTVRSGHG